MKSLIKILVLSVLASAFVLQAGEDSRPYFKLEAGPSIQQDIKVKSTNGVATPGSKLKSDPGARFDVIGGYIFTESFAVEAEAGMLFNSISKFTGPAGESKVEDVNLWQVPFLANFIYTLPLRSRLRPYLGVGGGGIWSLLETPSVRNQEDFTIAYQGQAGVNYFINDQMDLGLGYKFLGSLDHDWGELKTRETYSHSLLLQFTFKY